MSLVKYQPAPLDWFGDEIRSIFGWMPALKERDGNIFDWQPRMDVEEFDNNFLIKVDIPGVNPKDIKVDITNNQLTVQGERSQEKNEKGRYERFSGKFYRCIQLPSEVNGDKAVAKGKHGVLKIKVPKQESKVTRYIEVEGE